MTESIALDVHLQAFVRRDTSRRWIATCPMVGVASQGKSADDARRCLQEAIELWFESCVERGVLDQALREANFRPLHSDRAGKDLGEDIIRSNMKTLSLTRKEFERLLAIVRGHLR